MDHLQSLHLHESTEWSVYEVFLKSPPLVEEGLQTIELLDKSLCLNKFICSYSYLAAKGRVSEFLKFLALFDVILVCSWHLLKLPSRTFHICYPLSSKSVFNSPPSSCISSSNYSSISVPFIILFCWYCHPTFKILLHLIESFKKIYTMNKN